MQQSRIPIDQILLTFVLIAIISPLLSFTMEDAILPTNFLLFSVSFGGLWLISRFRLYLGDSKLNYLGYIWLLKILLTFFFLYLFWIPKINSVMSYDLEHDVIRYYFQGQDLADNSWIPNTNINYMGILYYYGFVFTIIGHNPIIPALINDLTTLLSLLILVRTAYEIKTFRAPNDWRLGFAMIFPEIVLFDLMTSRETITMMLLTVIGCTIGRHFYINRKTSLFYTLLISLFCLLGIAAIRASMLIPATVFISLMALISNAKRIKYSSKVFIIVVNIILLFGGPIITKMLGGYEFTFNDILIINTHSAENISGSSTGWTEKSVGSLFLPNNTVEAVLFSFPRLIIYMISPLSPNFSFLYLDDPLKMWYSLLSGLSSVLYIIWFPLALASLINAIKTRNVDARKFVFHLPFWIILYSVAAGNQIIDARYRIMSDMFFLGCVWLGSTTCPKNLVRNVSFIWYSLIASGSIFYIAYKSISSI